MSYHHELVTSVTNLLLVCQSVEMCLDYLEVEFHRDWEMVPWEMLKIVMKDHYL